MADVTGLCRSSLDASARPLGRSEAAVTGLRSPNSDRPCTPRDNLLACQFRYVPLDIPRFKAYIMCIAHTMYVHCVDGEVLRRWVRCRSHLGWIRP